MPYIFSSFGAQYLLGGYIAYIPRPWICQTEATEAVLEPLIVTQLIAVFLGIARSRAWVGFWCGVFMYSARELVPCSSYHVEAAGHVTPSLELWAVSCSCSRPWQLCFWRLYRW